MKSKKIKEGPNEPTRSELEILQVLWQHGPSTARFVNDYLNKEKREVIYMSTLKLMQIMLDKGLLEKDDSPIAHIYRAAAEEAKTKGQLLDKMVENVFGGSAGSLMMQLVGSKQLSPTQMEEVKELIKKIDEK
jgi:BlaI family penicillinase repressor